jgi:hypothetical protein
VLQFVTRHSGVDLFLHYYYKSCKGDLPELHKASKRTSLCDKSLSEESKGLVAAQIKVLTLEQDLEECVSGVDPPDLQEALIIGIAPILRAN